MFRNLTTKNFPSVICLYLSIAQARIPIATIAEMPAALAQYDGALSGEEIVSSSVFIEVFADKSFSTHDRPRAPLGQNRVPSLEGGVGTLKVVATQQGGNDVPLVKPVVAIEISVFPGGWSTRQVLAALQHVDHIKRVKSTVQVRIARLPQVGPTYFHVLHQTPILLVDDSNAVLLMEKLLLKRGGYRLVEARDGEEALTVAETEKPDLILMDVIMPKMGGFEACRAMRRMEATRDTLPTPRSPTTPFPTHEKHPPPPPRAP